MTLKVQCSFCNVDFEVDDLPVGSSGRRGAMRVRCPACRRIMLLPPAEELALNADLEQVADDEVAAKDVQPPAPDDYEIDSSEILRATAVAPSSDRPAPTPEPSVRAVGPRTSEALRGGASGAPHAANQVAGRERLVGIFAAVIAAATALALWESFGAIWAAVASASGIGLHDAAAGLRDWGLNLVPSLKELGPGGKPFGILDHVVIAGTLAILAVRAMFRIVLLYDGYASEEGSVKRGAGGLVFHFAALLMLVVLAGWGANAAQRGDVGLVAWFIAAFMLVSALSLIIMRFVSGIRGHSVAGRMCNDAILGGACLFVVLTGGIPHAPFNVVEQCAIIALANSTVGLAIAGSAFESDSSGLVVKRLGFSALGVIIFLLVAVLFATTGRAH